MFHTEHDISLNTVLLSRYSTVQHNWYWSKHGLTVTVQHCTAQLKYSVNLSRIF